MFESIGGPSKIVVGEGEIKVWEEGPGQLELAD